MNLQDCIARYSVGYDLPTLLVTAIARVESGLLGTAIRFEPDYRWLWDMNNNRPFRHPTEEERYNTHAPDDFNAGRPEITGFYCSDDTEWIGQHISWGPFQMMGAVLRETGYKGPLPELCVDPDLASRFACVHLSKLKYRYFNRHGWSGVVAAYNAGRPRRDDTGRFFNQEYVNKVSQAGAGSLVIRA